MICINNIIGFTLYKNYNVIEIIEKHIMGDIQTYYLMENDNNFHIRVNQDNFISLDEYRSNQIDKILI